MRVARWMSPVSTLGPGRRTALWLAGCSIRCPHCITPGLQNPDAGFEMDERALAVMLELMMSVHGAAGLTITGGEPLDQAEALVCLLNMIRTGDVLLYTGRSMAAVRQMSVWPYLAKRLAAIIPEPYVARLNQGQPLRGSGNQPLIVLNSAYCERYRQAEKLERALQVVSLADGVVFAGIPHGDTGLRIKESEG